MNNMEMFITISVSLLVIIMICAFCYIHREPPPDKDEEEIDKLKGELWKLDYAAMKKQAIINLKKEIKKHKK